MLMNKLYDNILYSINAEVKQAIKEQFNIGNMDLNRKSEKKFNIFNKNIRHIEIYDNIQNNGNVSESDIEYLNEQISIISPKNKNEL